MFRPIAGLLPPFAIVEHQGRATGRPYRTPVFAFRRGGELVVVLSYGSDCDWLRNLLATGGGGVVRSGRRRALTNLRVVPAGRCGPLSPLGRFSTRFADEVLVADLAPGPGDPGAAGAAGTG
jgi:deazaflavin-dependent oxidoreductase (nitroreductase family)